MRRESHRMLGVFLAAHYLGDIQAVYRKAFLLGCTEPDINPTTYLKGSLRAQWLRGHNYENANHFTARIAERLEKKQQYSIWDYYSLGKLLHYTADAFTLAHNDHFPADIHHHRVYEAKLQKDFLPSLSAYRPEKIHPEIPIQQYVQQMHNRYIVQPACIETDIHFILMVCCTVIQKLTIHQDGNVKDSTSLLGKNVVF